MPDLVKPAEVPSESQAVVQVFQEFINVTREDRGDRRFDMESNRLKIEGEIRNQSEKLQNEKYAIDKYYENDRMKFQFRAGFAIIVGTILLVVAVTLLIFANSYDQRIQLLQKIVGLLVAMLGGKTFFDLFNKEKPPHKLD